MEVFDEYTFNQKRIRDKARSNAAAADDNMQKARQIIDDAKAESEKTGEQIQKALTRPNPNYRPGRD